MAPVNITPVPSQEGMGEPSAPISQTQLFIVMGILSFLSVIGTSGNALVLYVFAKKRDRLTSTLFILALAFVDFITCLIVIPYTIYMEYVDFHIQYDFACKAYQFFITSNIPFSALIMVAIAIDRYFCICHPFLHAINMFRAKLIVAFLALIAVSLGVVVALMYGVYGTQTVGGLDSLLHNVTVDATPGPTASGGHVVKETKYDITGGDASRDAGATPSPQNHTRTIIIYTGECQTNYFVWSERFQWHYHKIYSSLFLACLLVVIILYVLIYKSVLTRRSRRQRQRSRLITLTTTTHDDNDNNGQVEDNNGNGHVEETYFTTVNGDAADGGGGTSGHHPHGSTEGITTTTAASTTGASTTGAGSSSEQTNRLKPPAPQKEKPRSAPRRRSGRRDRNRVANLKTAAMLFVVTVVFIVTFLPSFLMALNVLTYNVIVFYLYFANNVANPVIYSFMNKNFRDDLRKLFCGQY